MNKFAPGASSTQESSVLFSLNELLELENERVLSEQEQRRQVEEAALERRRREAEAERRAQEERLQRAEEDRRREELTRREEQARLSAIQVAEVEKARRLAESESRLRLLEKQQEHERAILSLGQDRARKRLRLVAAGSVLLALLLAGAGALLVRDAHQRLHLDRARAAEEWRRLQDEKDQQMATLRAKLEKLDRRDEGRRKEIQEEMEQLGKDPVKKPRRPPPVTPGRERTKPPPQMPPTEVCLEGDPMCTKDF